MKTQTTFRDVNVRVHASKLKFALIFAFIFSVFQSQTYTFTGNGDGTSWTDAANWTGATGIPYIDDTTCSVNVGSFTVTIPSSTNLTMESGTVSGAGKIINNGNFTVETVGSKYFSIATFENNGDFIMGNTDVNAVVYLSNNHLFKNNSVGEIIANGIVFYNNGAHTVQNDGLFRKIGNFSENFNCVFVNNATIDVQAGTLIFSGNKEFNGGTYNVASGARLETTNSLGVLSGTLSGNIQGTFLLNGTNSVAASTTATNALAGTGILMESGTIQGGGKFINETIFTVNDDAVKHFTIAAFENTGTFNLGTGTATSGFLYLSNNTLIDNKAAGQINVKGLAFINNGPHSVKNAGIFRKTESFAATFNIYFVNEGQIDVQAGTLIFSGNKEFNGGTYNVASGARLETTNSLGVLSGTLSGNIQGTFLLNGTNSVAASTTATNALAGTGILMESGTIQGGGKFINQTIFTANTDAVKHFTIADFENQGTTNLGTGTNVNGFIYLSNSVNFTNTLDGTVVANGLAFINNGPHTFTNLGLFRKTGNFSEQFNNVFVNEGQISVEEGTLQLSGSKTLKTGEYNVAENSTLETINSGILSGIWTGTNAGTFNLNGNNAVQTETTITNQISGNGLTMVAGTISGAGKFINESTFTALGEGVKSFTLATYDNKGIFNLGDGTNANGYIYLTNHTFNNLGTGEVLAKGLTFIINGVHMVNNAGTFRKLGNFDETFNVNVTNTGNIVGEAGRIIFSGSLNNTTTGRISGFAIGTPAGNNFTNNGILAPGLSPGDLNVSGQLKLTNGILEIELNGNTPGTQYDQVSYNGTTAVSLSGNIHVSLGFAPAVGSQFIVVKSATAPITSTLAVTPYAEYEGNHYYFTVTNATNQVVLTVSNITLGTGQTEILKTKVYPNPVVGNLHYQSAEHLVGYELINTAGQNIRNGKLQGKTGEINMDNLKSGMYILILKYRDRTEHMKLIKK